RSAGECRHGRAGNCGRLHPSILHVPGLCPGVLERRSSGPWVCSAGGETGLSQLLDKHIEKIEQEKVAPQANYGQHKHKDVGHVFAFRTATVLKKARGVAVVACRGSAGVSAESTQHLWLPGNNCSAAGR